MLEQICSFIHNYFDADRYGRTYTHKTGEFTIEDGGMSLPFLAEGQYYRIIGSRFNDGVYRYGVDALTDETFEGEVWEMRPPKSFLSLVTDIEAWQGKYGDAADSPYQSENVIGVYSYQLKTSGLTTGTFEGGWQQTYKTQLNEWRKIS